MTYQASRYLQFACREKLTEAEAVVERLALQLGVKREASKATKIVKATIVKATKAATKTKEQLVTPFPSASPGNQVDQQEKPDKNTQVKTKTDWCLVSLFFFFLGSFSFYAGKLTERFEAH
jgi:hypothetical protein